MEKKKSEQGRWTSQRKMEAVLRLLRGELLDELSRELGVTAAKLSQWKDTFLNSGQDGLKAQKTDHSEQEIQRLRAKVGELTMENELLFERARRAEDKLPFRFKKSR